MISILSLLYNECSKLEKIFHNQLYKKDIKKEENFTVVFPYFFNLNLNYEKI